jgi:hypothetical protein
MITYKLLSNDIVAKIDDDGVSRMSCHISDPDYIKWLNNNTPLPADPITRSIIVVTARQARRALKEAGLLDAVTAWVATASDEVKIDWEFATEIHRDWSLMEEAASDLGITSSQLDYLFIRADTFI